MRREEMSLLRSNIRLVYDAAALAQFYDLGAALEADESLNSIKLDPYWPKWDSPWWKAVLLLECGQAELIPRQQINCLNKTVAGVAFCHQMSCTKEPFIDVRISCSSGCTCISKQKP